MIYGILITANGDITEISEKLTPSVVRSTMNVEEFRLRCGRDGINAFTDEESMYTYNDELNGTGMVALAGIVTDDDNFTTLYGNILFCGEIDNSGGYLPLTAKQISIVEGEIAETRRIEAMTDEEYLEWSVLAMTDEEYLEWADSAEG